MAVSRSFRGLTFGGPGDDVQMLTEEGLDDMVVSAVSPSLPRYDGAIPGDHTADLKTITGRVWWQSWDPSEAEEIGRQVRAAFQRSRIDLAEYAFTRADGFSGVVFARCVRRSQPRNQESETSGYFELAYQLEVPDPVVYGASQTITLSPAAPSEGLDYPVTYPKQYGAAGTGGEDFDNSGDWETWPVFQISGPSAGALTNPTITAPGLDKKLELTANGGVSISTGQTLEISTHPRARYIRFLTGASRRGKLSADSEFFPLPPGVTELRFNASGSTTGAQVTVTARPAYI